MAVVYKLHEEALKEYINAYVWYEAELPGLGERFISAIDKQVEKICAHPNQYGFVHGRYRQIKIKRFPFAIVYEYFPDRELIHISSIHHTSRDPDKKYRKEE